MDSLLPPSGACSVTESRESKVGAHAPQMSGASSLGEHRTCSHSREDQTEDTQP